MQRLLHLCVADDSVVVAVPRLSRGMQTEPVRTTCVRAAIGRVSVRAAVSTAAQWSLHQSMQRPAQQLVQSVQRSVQRSGPQSSLGLRRGMQTEPVCTRCVCGHVYTRHLKACRLGLQTQPPSWAQLPNPDWQRSQCSSRCNSRCSQHTGGCSNPCVRPCSSQYSSAVVPASVSATVHAAARACCRRLGVGDPFNVSAGARRPYSLLCHISYHSILVNRPWQPPSASSRRRDFTCVGTHADMQTCVQACT